MVKATPEQHAELDVEWRALLDCIPDSISAFHERLAALGMWKSEKVYLSTYGQRPPRITNIKVPGKR